MLGECIKRIPNKQFVYFADNFNVPYGNYSEEKILILANKIFSEIQQYNPIAAVIACNTVTAVCIEYLRNKYSFPIIGIQPAIKPAARAPRKPDLPAEAIMPPTKPTAVLGSQTELSIPTLTVQAARVAQAAKVPMHCHPTRQPFLALVVRVVMAAAVAVAAGVGKPTTTLATTLQQGPLSQGYPVTQVPEVLAVLVELVPLVALSSTTAGRRSLPLVLSWTRLRNSSWTVKDGSWSLKEGGKPHDSGRVQSNAPNRPHSGPAWRLLHQQVFWRGNRCSAGPGCRTQRSRLFLTVPERAIFIL